MVYSSIELSTCSHISLILQIIFSTACCHLWQNWYYAIADGGHLGDWRPYWNNLNIWIVFITLIAHFACSKHTLCCHNNLLWPFTASLKAKNNIYDYPMAAILKNGGHIEILRGPRFFLEKCPPIEYFGQICCLYHNLNDSYSYLLHYRDSH